jgi:hypothetical protein
MKLKKKIIEIRTKQLPKSTELTHQTHNIGYELEITL